jgi:hypothetical protein
MPPFVPTPNAAIGFPRSMIHRQPGHPAKRGGGGTKPTSQKPYCADAGTQY